MVAWCHGAAGIGLSRLGMLLDPDAQTYEWEIAVAVDTTLASGFGDNHCLCHGDLGNLDFILQAAQALNNEAWNAAVQRLTLRILGQVEQDGWRCGLNKPVDTPGLMTGLAGIGYGMLRLAAPQTVPPVTTLCPPLITAQHA
jgi:lantibiotic modifying enzyme